MRFFRKIDIAKPIKQEKKGNEHLSYGTIKPLPVERNNLYKKIVVSDEKNQKDEKNSEEIVLKENGKGETGNENKAFESGEENFKKNSFIRKQEKSLGTVPEKNEEEEDIIEEKIDEPNNTTEPPIQLEETVQERKYSFCQKFYNRLKNLISHPNFIHWCALSFIAFSIWSIIYSVAGTGFIPGTQLFSLLILFLLAFLAGETVKLIKLPPLLGMLLMGLLLRNIGFVHLKGVYVEITATLREVALCIILIRAGLGLDPKALNSLRYVILRLASVPGIIEGIITMIVTHFLLGLPWLWGCLAGAILAAVSPAVVIPCLFSLQERGYGKGKGIPTLVVASASLDDIIAITAFGVVLNVIYSTGASFTMQVIQGPLGIIMGIVFGLLWGFICQKIPHQKDDQAVLLRVLMIIGGGLMAIVGSKAVGYQGAGPLGCIIAAFVACFGWRQQNYTEEYNPVASVFRIIWLIFQPILFSLVGAEVDVTVLELSLLANCLLSLICCLVGRIVVTVFIAFGAGFNWKEKVFISLAWFPKATVQAALGPLALDTAKEKGSEEEVEHGRRILILAVLAILITAPIGAALITTLGPKFLSKNDGKTPQEEVNDENLESRTNQASPD